MAIGSDIVLRQVIDNWRQAGVSMLDALDEAEIRQRFEQAGLPCAEDVVALYSQTAGMADGEIGPGCFTLWQFDRVIEAAASRPRRPVRFADYLLGMHVFGFAHLDMAHSNVQICHFEYRGEPGQVAGSLDEFFSLYLAHSPRLQLRW